jgi:hypothetical protein
MYYKWTGRKRVAVTKPRKEAPIFFLCEEFHKEWVNPHKLRKKRAKNKKKRPGHIPAYDEWPEWEPEHRAMLAAEAREAVREKKRAKRKRYKNNRWWRQNS